MRKFLLGFIRVVCVMAVLGIGAVIALDQYYQHVFPMFVTMNGIYCTGMTVGNATEVLNDSNDLHNDRITVRMLDGEIYEMAVDGHIGMHDATWRKDFGGECTDWEKSYEIFNIFTVIMLFI